MSPCSDLDEVARVLGELTRVERRWDVHVVAGAPARSDDEALTPLDKSTRTAVTTAVTRTLGPRGWKVAAS